MVQPLNVYGFWMLIHLIIFIRNVFVVVYFVFRSQSKFSPLPSSQFLPHPMYFSSTISLQIKESLPWVSASHCISSCKEIRHSSSVKVEWGNLVEGMGLQSRQHSQRKLLLTQLILNICLLTKIAIKLQCKS